MVPEGTILPKEENNQKSYPVKESTHESYKGPALQNNPGDIVMAHIPWW